MKKIIVSILVTGLLLNIAPLSTGGEEAVKEPLSVAGALEKYSMSTFDRDILYVGGTGPGNYSSIQDAIDDASDGDTIFVYNYSSPYYGNIVIDKTINLIGEDRDTTIIDGSGSGDVVYITADEVSISSFTIQNNGEDTGIDVHSNYNTIYQNTIRDNYNGIYLKYSSHNTITDNTITNNTQWGIILRSYSSINNISENIVNYNGMGIVIWKESSDNIISENTVANNRHGLEMGISYNNTIVDNNFVSNGIRLGAYGEELGHWNSHTIENNYANGKPIYYYKNIDDQVVAPSDAAQVILANCSNFTIQNLDLFDVDVGIQLGYSSYCAIAENIITNNDYGFSLQNSSYNNITDCTTYNNVFYGIKLTCSSNNNIINCIAYNTSHTLVATHSQAGFYLYNSCSNNIINCTAYGNMNSGFLLVSDSAYNLITNCASYDNGIYGYGGRGIALGSYYPEWGFCHDNIISGSTIFSNHIGIYLSYSSGNTILRNTITNNEYGVRIKDSSNNNIIYHNNFINNNPNAYDSCDNIWDDGYPSGGNYWDDYTGNDSNGDGIGDTPYYIPGGDNLDRYPLMKLWSNEPPDIPIIDGPISGTAGTTYDYTFVATDPDGDQIKYIIDWGDDTTDTTEFYDSGVTATVSHSWDTTGTYTIKAKAVDEHDAESDWGTLEVTMPVNQQSGQNSSQNSSQNSQPTLRGIFFNLLERVVQNLR